MNNFYDKFPKTTAKERKLKERMERKYSFISKVTVNERGRTYKKPEDTSSAT